MSRRLVSLLATILFCGAGARGQAAWLEPGNGSSTPTPVPTPWNRWYNPTPTPYPYPTPYYVPPQDGGATALHDFLASAWLGTPYGWGGLTIYPIMASRGVVGSGVDSLDYAVRRGSLRVYENGGGMVSSVLVENGGSTPVFLMAGEVILGGKQDRIIRQDMVIAGRSGPVGVPVYCVEEGRWTVSTKDFEPAPYAVDSGIRSKAAAGAPQSEIWSDVQARQQSAGVTSSTQAYRDFEQSKDVARRLDDYVSRCPRPTAWRGRAVGAIFVSGGTVLGVDVFGDNSLLASEWGKLVRSYAAQVPTTYYRGPEPDCRGCGDSASSVFAQLQSAWPQYESWAGTGVRYQLPMSGYAASGLVYGGRAVHIAALPGGYVIEEPPYYDPPYDPPAPRPWYNRDE